MAPTPTFELAGATPSRPDDMLDVVAGLDREINKLTAMKAIALDLAHREALDRAGRAATKVGPHFNDRVMAERSFRAEVAALLTISERAAENLIGMSTALKSLPGTLKALQDGEISWRHATVMVNETSCVYGEDLAKLEQQALAHPAKLTPPKLARFLKLTREKLNPETITARHTAALERRGVAIDDIGDGLSIISATVASIHAHAIFNRLTKGAHATDGPLETRGLNERRADIFTHIMLAEVDGEVFGVVPDPHDDTNFTRWFRGIHANVVLTVPVLTLLGHSDEPATLEGRVPIDIETATILAAGAKSFLRVLTQPETGAILSVGRRRYKVPKDLRRVIEIRDQTCRFPGCMMPAARSEIDHTLDWQYGGETKLGNLGCACVGHHDLKDNCDWDVTQDADGRGIETWTSPTGRMYKTYPHAPYPNPFANPFPNPEPNAADGEAA